jgi:hypothetical protein
MADSELPSSKLRATTAPALEEPLELTGQTPTPEEFVPAVANAILYSADVASTVLPGAREQIVRLVEAGDRPAAWSAGYIEHQHRKLGKTGLVDLVATQDIDPSVEVTVEHGEPIEIQTAIAPDKTTTEIIARVREIADQDQIVVVDDRVENLRAFLGAIPEAKAAIWVQFGAHARREMDKLARGENLQLDEAIAEGTIIPIASIDQLADKVAELRASGTLTEERAAVFVDYDDTLSDNARRRDMELAAAVDAIFENGWA